MLPSLVSIMATLRWMHSDTVDVDAVVKSAVGGTAIAMDLVMQWRGDGTIPDDRIIDVRFDDLVGDPVAHAAQRCTNASVRRSRADAEAAHARVPRRRRPRERHGRHDYEFADTGLDLDETRARFANYQAHYGIPSEV